MVSSWEPRRASWTSIRAMYVVDPPDVQHPTAPAGPAGAVVPVVDAAGAGRGRGAGAARRPAPRPSGPGCACTWRRRGPGSRSACWSRRTCGSCRRRRCRGRSITARRGPSGRAGGPLTVISTHLFPYWGLSGGRGAIGWRVRGRRERCRAPGGLQLPRPLDRHSLQLATLPCGTGAGTFARGRSPDMATPRCWPAADSSTCSARCGTGEGWTVPTPAAGERSSPAATGLRAGHAGRRRAVHACSVVTGGAAVPPSDHYPLLARAA